MKDLTNIETDELLQMYANADVTCSCIGHHKGAMNEFYRQKYAEELEKRDVMVPKNYHDKYDKNFVSSVKIPKGIYNGEGAY